MFADGNILELEVVWAVAGLGILKLNPVVVKGLIGDDGKTGIIFQIQVRFVRLGHALHCNGSLTCGDGDPQIIFQIIIDGIAGDFRGQISYLLHAEIIVIQNERNSIQVTQTLNVVQFGAERETGLFRDFFVGG